MEPDSTCSDSENDIGHQERTVQGEVDTSKRDQTVSLQGKSYWVAELREAVQYSSDSDAHYSAF